MSNAPNRILKIFGFLLLCAVPLGLFGAGAYSYFQPRLYQAATVLQLADPAADAPRMADAFEKARQRVPTLLLMRLTYPTTLTPSATPGEYRITALEADPLAAANIANILTVSISEALRAANPDGGRRMTVVQKASPPTAPSFPNVRRIMLMGTLLSLLLGAAGIVLLILGYTRPATP